MQVSPQVAADSLLLDTSKILGGQREDIEAAIEIGASLMGELLAMSEDYKRPANSRAADKKRVKELSQLLVLLAQQLRKLGIAERQQSSEATLWEKMKQSSGIAKQP